MEDLEDCARCGLRFSRSSHSSCPRCAAGDRKVRRTARLDAYPLWIGTMLSVVAFVELLCGAASVYRRDYGIGVGFLVGGFIALFLSVRYWSSRAK